MIAAEPDAWAGPQSRDERFARCEWKAPDGRQCFRMKQHALDLANPEHRVRLSVAREYDVSTGQLVREYDVD